MTHVKSTVLKMFSKSVNPSDVVFQHLSDSQQNLLGSFMNSEISELTAIFFSYILFVLSVISFFFVSPSDSALLLNDISMGTSYHPRLKTNKSQIHQAFTQSSCFQKN